MSLSRPSPPTVVEDYNKLIEFADHLVETGAFAGPGEVVYFFEKPWKWQEQFEAWQESENEPTWETEEMGRWISNTEPLHLSCEAVSASMIEFVVKQWLLDGRPDGFNVELDLVDWDQVKAGLG